ncbi:MAG: hypothetical protein LBE48_03520, partial [Methanomassiliicoccaceae archaeon]|nr:hypothetical protein [Methanomassiliicoccaceae archaeon]
MTKQDMYNEFVRIANEVYTASHANENDLQDLQHRPHLFVFSCVMDSQIKYEKALAIPRIIAEDLGDDSFKVFAEQPLEYYSNIFR